MGTTVAVCPIMNRRGDSPAELHAGSLSYRCSDEQLREAISERLMQADDIDSSAVTVRVLGGRVVLEGTVPDLHMKHAIEHLADAAPGAQDVENRIRIGGAGAG